MGKTRAEIQKAYRERQKEKNGEAYLAKERQRRMKYYIPSSELTDKEKRKRTKQNREGVQRFRNRKKAEALQAVQEAAVLSPSDTSGYDTVDNIGSPINDQSDHNQMVVRMNFQTSANKRAGTRRRTSRALAKAHKTISQLKMKNLSLARKYKTIQKRRERMRSKISSSSNSPRTRTEHDLRHAGISKTQGDKVRRQLLLGNALLSEIEQAKTEVGRTKNKEKALHSLICGKIIKKYRGLSWLAARTGINRNKLSVTGKKWTTIPKQKRLRTQMKYREQVLNFFEREDNSRIQPGKADAKPDINGVKIQTRVLTDYLANLHLKFLSENPGIVLSRATFCRMRPRHVLTTNFISRSSCLCTKHQNMALLLKTLRREGVNVSANPDTFIKTQSITGEDLASLPDMVSVGQWKRVEVTEKDRKKSVMRIVDSVIEKNNLIPQIASQVEDFKGHVERVKTQYEQIRRLKEHLPEHNMLVQMDFSENYSCKSVEEIQSAYWNQSSVTLHPVVAYYKQDNKLLHQSFVMVSDDLSHTAAAVHAFMNVIIHQLRILDPEVKTVHYWTDGPTSQYRNKQMFYTTANHLEMFGTNARWNYFEVGHGKGPCDGLGGTTKRMADEAVRSGRAIIQDAKDFMKWADNSTMKDVKFVYVSSTDCQREQAMLAARSVKVLKGTFAVHAVTGLGNSTVAVRDVSCYCDICLDGDICSSWRKECLATSASKSAAETNAAEKNDTEKSTGSVTPQSHHSDVTIDDFVGAVYERTWYVGKVQAIDDEDGEMEISFLQRKKNMFQWPHRHDVIWVAKNDILCKIDAPVPSGKSQRMLKLSQSDSTLLMSKFEARMSSM